MSSLNNNAVGQRDENSANLSAYDSYVDMPRTSGGL